MTFLAVALILAISLPVAADVLRYSYHAGDQYRLVDHVRETVAINGQYSHRSEILDRIAVTVNQVAADGMSASHSAQFQTSERAWGSQGSYAWEEDYDSEFVRDGQGHYTIDPSYWMPVVRDVPLFPDHSISPGDTWSAPGYEIHDLRQSFGMPDPFRFPITVSYQWLRSEKRDGIDCAVIGISYDVFYKTGGKPRTTNTYPTRVTGTSQQTLWWDL
ncbi:MAG TPA: OmpA family protein, partial [Spirochaetia bacterium]|nr:OmpA family protein [Spirochaetia bacterium]